jgi:glycosyltransferase involved in cell wall biosynthesis
VSGTQVFNHSEQRKKSRKHKLLFLAHPFPPAHTIGAVRTWNIAKYLSRLGWEVTVVTPRPELRARIDDPDGVAANIERERIKTIFTDHDYRFLYSSALRTSRNIFRRAARAAAQVVARKLHLDSASGWIRPVMRSCAHLRPDDVDVILATGGPYSSFEIASRLARRLNRPYVMDYRDPWTWPHRPAPTRVVGKERALLHGAAAAITVSASWTKLLADRFDLGSRVHTITNGYDPEDMAKVAPKRFDHFAIIYAGTFYPPRRVVTPLMLALEKLKDHPVRWSLHYYGLHQDHVAEEAGKLGLTSRVVIHGYVPRRESMAAMRGASVAVTISSDNDGSIPAKLFELIALGAPILFIGPPQGDAAAICKETGGAVFGSGDTEGIASFLASLMDGRKLQLRYGETYSWPVLARKFERVLLDAAGLDKPAAEPPSYGDTTAAAASCNS